MKHLARLPLGRFLSSPQSLPLFVGLSLVLTGCPEGSIQVPDTIVFDEVSELTVQPIQVCNNSGNDCADVNLFADITRKILRQAQLKVSFLPTTQLNASRFLKIDYSANKNSSNYEFFQLTRTEDASTQNFGRHPLSTEESGPINVWFVDEIEGNSSATQFGLAWVDANGVVISQDALDFNNGEGRPDILAHEIGHNLGLQHRTLGAGGANNLLTDGDRRNVPNSVDDIVPDGARLSALTDAQRREIKNSGFLNPVASADQASVTAADLSTRSATQLIEQMADLAQATTISMASLPPSALAPDVRTADSVATESVPEPMTLLGLGLLGGSLLTIKRRSSSSTPPTVDHA